MSIREAVARELYERIYVRDNPTKKKFYAWPPSAAKKWFDHADAILAKVADNLPCKPGACACCDWHR